MSRVGGNLCDKQVLQSFDVDDIASNFPDRRVPALFMNISAAIHDSLLGRTVHGGFAYRTLTVPRTSTYQGIDGSGFRAPFPHPPSLLIVRLVVSARKHFSRCGP